MKLSFSFSIDKAYRFLKKYGTYVLGAFFLLFLLAVIYGYYQYLYLVIRSGPGSQVQKAEINQEEIDKVFERIQEREENLQRVKTNSYRDPFSG